MHGIPRPSKSATRSLSVWRRTNCAVPPRDLTPPQMCIVHFKERERIAPGARMDDRVLFIEEVTYESVRRFFLRHIALHDSSGQHPIACGCFITDAVP